MLPTFLRWWLKRRCGEIEAMEMDLSHLERRLRAVDPDAIVQPHDHWSRPQPSSALWSDPAFLVAGEDLVEPLRLPSKNSRASQASRDAERLAQHLPRLAEYEGLLEKVFGRMDATRARPAPEATASDALSRDPGVDPEARTHRTEVAQLEARARLWLGRVQQDDATSPLSSRSRSRLEPAEAEDGDEDASTGHRESKAESPRSCSIAHEDSATRAATTLRVLETLEAEVRQRLKHGVVHMPVPPRPASPARSPPTAHLRLRVLSNEGAHALEQVRRLLSTSPLAARPRRRRPDDVEDESDEEDASLDDDREASSMATAELTARGGWGIVTHSSSMANDDGWDDGRAGSEMRSLAARLIAKGARPRRGSFLGGGDLLDAAEQGWEPVDVDAADNTSSNPPESSGGGGGSGSDAPAGVDVHRSREEEAEEGGRGGDEGDEAYIRQLRASVRRPPPDISASVLALPPPSTPRSEARSSGFALSREKSLSMAANDYLAARQRRASLVLAYSTRSTHRGESTGDERQE